MCVLNDKTESAVPSHGLKSPFITSHTLIFVQGWQLSAPPSLTSERCVCPKPSTLNLGGGQAASVGLST